MIRANFSVALKKGAIGEQIIRQKMEQKGWTVYMPLTEGAHHFDMLATLRKERAIALDVKTKSRMNKWNATGVNQRHFEQYQQFSQLHNMPFWIVFVDEGLKSIYGNELKSLEVPYHCEVDGYTYPRTLNMRNGGCVRLWPLNTMVHLGDLSDEKAAKLTELSQRNYGFEPAGGHKSTGGIK